ncbi:MAG TPA: class I SAM-dependent methyltransferase [Arenimonas sp.]|nr:class I SAM-dependent methyltransferase [Arenimonas sp.]
MRIVSIVLATTALFLSNMQGVYASSEKDIAQSLANPARSAADRERDARDKPQDVLELAGFKKGMVIADVFGGGGYYAEILSRAVGNKGKVLLLNNGPYDSFAGKEWQARQKTQGLANVEYRKVENTNLTLQPNSLDGALIILSYHDLFMVDASYGWTAIDDKAFMGQIVNALKPNGKLLIVDHTGKEGTGTTETGTLHRIEEKAVIKNMRSYGLEWSSSISVLRNKADTLTVNVFDPAIKGKTDRFVHVYHKPAK